ncbi:MAG: sigma-70 family RNA polymerase sigma factor [Archangiaceae bacterium]|nr:sigma-70 family RNA polymerase sigma factor [Archangiaceae bacterium]
MMDAGDASALWQAYAAELGPVCSLLRRLGVRDVEDVAHDTLVVAWQRRADFQAGRELRPWLMGIAVMLSRGRSGRAAASREVLEPPPDVADPSDGPDEAMKQAQRRRLLARALEGLDEDQRTAFVWHDLEERPVAELAAALEVPSNTIYSRLRLARQKVNAAFATHLSQELR